jgi:hypothetical protein
VTEQWEDFTHIELSSPFSNAKDESDSDESSSSDFKYSTGLTLKAIHESLSELSQVGSAIRQSSTTPEAVRARKFIRCSRALELEQISFEKLSLIALGSLYPNAPRSLLIQLGKSMVDRRARLLFRKSRHETLGHNVRSHAVEPETTEQTAPLSDAGSKSTMLPPQTPAAQKLGTSPASRQHAPGSTIAPSSFHPSQFATKRKAASLGIPKHGTTMVLASKNAPPVPNFKNGEETICHWCFKSIRKSLVENGGWSKLGMYEFPELLTRRAKYSFKIENITLKTSNHFPVFLKTALTRYLFFARPKTGGRTCHSTIQLGFNTFIYSRVGDAIWEGLILMTMNRKPLI